MIQDRLFFSEVADQFLLRSDITYLNNGAFRACPRPVFEQYQAWQRELEYQPVDFLGRRLKGLLQDAREPLAPFLGGNGMILFLSQMFSLCQH